MIPLRKFLTYDVLVWLLEKLEAEILIGQVSYKQKSDMYNYYNKYDTVTKQSRCPAMKRTTHIANDLDEDETPRYYILQLWLLKIMHGV